MAPQPLGRCQDLPVAILVAAILFSLLFAGSCAYHKAIPVEISRSVYVAQSNVADDLVRWAPAFVVYDYAHEYNRIGSPSAHYNPKGKETVFIDTRNPVAYFMKKEFSTQKGTYTNLVYRVHFPLIPFSLLPFNLGMGKNVGLIVVITLNKQKLPVLVTTVHTCGCYLAILPTSHLSPDAYPSNWDSSPIKVHGEVLPPILDYRGIRNPMLLVHLRPETHRVMDLEVVERKVLEDPRRFYPIPMALAPISNLTRIPLDGAHTSLFYESGILKGHVKGSIKPWESLLLSLISLDLFVGTDKTYAQSKLFGNPFYTSLKPWRRRDSDMSNFERFLKYYGWNL